LKNGNLGPHAKFQNPAGKKNYFLNSFWEKSKEPREKKKETEREEEELISK
jgi:hypothetical protein